MTHAQQFVKALGETGRAFHLSIGIGWQASTKELREIIGGVEDLEYKVFWRAAVKASVL